MIPAAPIVLQVFFVAKRMYVWYNIGEAYVSGATTHWRVDGGSLLRRVKSSDYIETPRGILWKGVGVYVNTQ